MQPNDAAIKSLVPRFRWGNIVPQAHNDRKRGANYQFYRLVPLDIIEIASVLGMKNHSREGVLEAVENNYWNCVEIMKREKVDRVILEGAPVSAQLGRAKTLELLAGAEKVTGVPADSDLEAIIAAMKHLGLTRVAVGSRWDDQLNSALVEYLADGGIEVVGITTRGQSTEDAAAMSLDDGLRIALEVGREAANLDSTAEAVYVAGGSALALHVIPKVEEEFGIPTLTQISATVWNGLVRPSVIDPIEGWGQLLTSRK